MHLVTNLRNVLDDLYDFRMKITGMGRSKTNAANSFDLGHSLQQFCKRGDFTRRIFPGIDGLTQQHNFLITFGTQLANLRKKMVAAPAALRSASVWHNTKRTKSITPFHNSYVGLVWGFSGLSVSLK